jgi:hypothetical protein
MIKKKQNKDISNPNILLSDRLMYINICEVTDEEGWGASINGVGNPVFIVENSETGAQTAFLRSEQGDVVVLHCPDADAIDRYIKYCALDQFNRLTKQQVDVNYLNEFIGGTVFKDPADFEFENDLETLLLEGEENFNDTNLAEVKNCFGIWVLLKDSIDIKFDIKNKSLIVDNEERFPNIEELFNDLFGNSEQVALILKK